jgi:hypothetical protein
MEGKGFWWRTFSIMYQDASPKASKIIAIARTVQALLDLPSRCHAAYSKHAAASPEVMVVSISLIERIVSRSSKARIAKWAATIETARMTAMRKYLLLCIFAGSIVSISSLRITIDSKS